MSQVASRHQHQFPWISELKRGWGLIIDLTTGLPSPRVLAAIHYHLLTHCQVVQDEERITT